MNTVPCDVFAMCETRLNHHGIRRVKETIAEQNWEFTAGLPQPQRREGIEGRYFYPIPGGVGAYIRSHLPFCTSARCYTEDWSDEDLRRNHSFSLFPGDGLEPIRVIQVYRYARAKDDTLRMTLDEDLLRKVFCEGWACGDIPVVIVGDMNIEAEYYPIICTEVESGRWTDAGRTVAELKDEAPSWKFNQKGTTSRLDLCFLNGAATQLFEKFEVWNHEFCTIPNHRMQCITLSLGKAKDVATKVVLPKTLPEFTVLPDEDCELISESVFSEYHGKLLEAFREKDINGCWKTWSQMAEEWLLQHAAISLGEDKILSDQHYRGRGEVRFQEVSFAKETKRPCA